MNNLFFIVGNLEKKSQEKNMFHELLMIQYNGLQYNITNIDFELSLFHFYFT
jgi:hypothetical protein